MTISRIILRLGAAAAVVAAPADGTVLAKALPAVVKVEWVHVAAEVEEASDASSVVTALEDDMLAETLASVVRTD